MGSALFTRKKTGQGSYRVNDFALVLVVAAAQHPLVLMTSLNRCLLCDATGR